MPEAGPGSRGAGWSRRVMLGIGGGLAAAAGAGALAGCSQTSSAKGRYGFSNASGTSASSGQVRRFRSRPDLRPVSAEVQTDSGRAAPGFIILEAHGGPGQQGPMILDGRGDLVWFKPLSANASRSHRAFSVDVQRYRGKPVLTWFEGAVVHAHGQGSYVLADSSYREIHRVLAGNGYHGDLHEFLITDQGTALFTCYGQATADLSAVGGATKGNYFYGVVQEVDIATGRVLFQWRSDEHVSMSESYAPVPKDGAAIWDHFHINSISVAPDGNLIVSARNTWTAYKIARPSGAVLWRLGGKKNDFAMGPGSHFSWQHHVTAHPDGTFAVFDNEAGKYKSGPQSRGLVLAVDEKKRRVSLTHSYVHSPRVLSPALGSVQLLGDGHVFVGWGEDPYFTEYRADGKVIFDGLLQGKGTRTYRAFRRPWTGRPSGGPALAVDRTAGGMDLYVSWNGDTQVRRWKILAGRDPGKLTAVAVAARRGFETKISVAERARYVAVAGLGGNGRELGRSKIHPVPSG